MSKHPYISKHCTPELLVKMASDYDTLAEACRDLKISPNGVKQAFLHYQIPYPFHRKPHYCYRSSASYNPNFFLEDNERSFYWAGFIAADGYIRINARKNGSTIYFVSIGLARAEKYHLEQFKTDLEYDGELYDSKMPPGKLLLKNHSHQETYYKTEINVCSKKLFDDIGRFGITPRKSYTYTMPEWLTKHPLVNHFIRGYIDGDGTIGFQKNQYIEGVPRIRISLVGACPAIRQIYDTIRRDCILRSGGSFYTKINEYSTLMNHFSFGSILDVKEVANYLYKEATVYLERKRQPTDKIDESIENGRRYYLEREQLIKDYEDLGSISAIARKHNCSNGVITTAFADFGIAHNSREQINLNKQSYHFDPVQLAKDYQDLKSATKLARKHQCSLYTILSHLRKHNIPVQQKSGNLPPKMQFDKETLTRQYIELQGHKEVAKLYGCSSATISYAMSELGIDCRALQKKKPFRDYDFSKETLEQQYQAYGTLKQVAKLYGCDPGTIAGAMKKLGIPYSSSHCLQPKKIAPKPQ